MAFLDWTDSYSVGVAKFDTQHKRLISYLNELHDAMSQGKGSEALGKILDGLIDYTRTHFKAEESVMQQYNYADFTSHKAEHDRLTAQVVELQEKFNGGQAVLSIKVMQFLKEWLTHHILETDKHYESFMKQAGIA